MKSNLFIMLIFLFSGGLVAQTTNATFVEVESSGLSYTLDETSETFLGYKIYKTTSGSECIKVMSSKGKLYNMWIGTATEFTYGGEPVRISSSGKWYVYYKSGRTVKKKQLRKQ